MLGAVPGGRVLWPRTGGHFSAIPRNPRRRRPDPERQRRGGGVAGASRAWLGRGARPPEKAAASGQEGPGRSSLGAAPHVGVAPLGDLGRGARLRRDCDPRGSHGPVIHAARPGHWLHLCFVGPQPARPSELRPLPECSHRGPSCSRVHSAADTRAPPGAPALRGAGRVPE